MLLRTRTTHSLFHFTLKPSIPKTLIFSRTCTATATVSPPVPSSPPPHPLPEWVSFVDRLKSHGYFPNSSPGDDGGSDDSNLVYRDLKLLKNPCISFARDHFDIFKSLSKDDIENVVEIGCPKLDRRVCNSAKRLREYVGLVEKNVCDVCSLRGSCKRAYLKPNDSCLVETVDVMRVLLFYSIHPMFRSGAVTHINNEKAVSSARRLLSMLMDLSEVSKSPVSEEIPYKKEKIVNLAATVVSQANGTRKQDWICPKCNYVNFSRNISCVKCIEDAPRRHVELRTGDAPWRHVEPKSGDWHCCTCQYLNYARNTQCRNCMEGDPEKKKRVHTELQKGDWNCPQCGSSNFSRKTVCFQCKATRPPESLDPGDWVCSMCNLLNFKGNVKCRKCENEHVKPSRQNR